MLGFPHSCFTLMGQPPRFASKVPFKEPKGTLLRGAGSPGLRFPRFARASAKAARLGGSGRGLHRAGRGHGKR